MENSVENRLGWILIRKYMFKNSVEERLKAPQACAIQDTRNCTENGRKALNLLVYDQIRPPKFVDEPTY